MRTIRSRTSLTLVVLALAGAARGQASNVVTAWPLSMQTPSGVIEVYEPQSEAFTGDVLTARAAVSVTPLGAAADQPVFGAIWFSARVSTDRDARTVTILDLQVKKVVFPTSDPAQQTQLTQVVQTQLPQLNVTFSLDQLMTGLDQAQKEKIESQQLSTAPPKIIFSSRPATLVTIDGEPKLQPIEGSGAPGGVLRVVNTPFVMLLDSPSKQYFLRAGDVWLTAPDVRGPWGNASTVPAGITGAAATMSDPTAPAAPPVAPVSPGPIAVFVALEPTELIVSSGAPTYTPLPGNDLLYMGNTASDVFIALQSQTYYVLLSGRWFASRSLSGPWAYTPPDSLPPAFAQIPTDSPKAHVLASVAGTPAAQDAKLDAVIPQTAAVPINSPGPAVTYDGDPSFQPVQGTQVLYAANTRYSVLNCEGSYYCCDQAVWYESTAPRGPWRVCVRVPGVIYTIPPSCPVYNCRFVYVYNSTPDVVYMGYLPGYTGCYVYGGTVVYGTGYAYPAWYHTEYIARPYTWGFAARYEPYHGVWAYGEGYQWDHRWFARPVHADEEHSGWFGPRGYVGYRSLAEPREVNINQTNIHVKNVTVNRTTVERINLYQQPSNNRRGVRVTQQVTDVHTPSARPGEDNVYAGRDGQVYRRTDTGWEQRGKTGWTQAAPAQPRRDDNPGADRKPIADSRALSNGHDRQPVAPTDRDTLRSDRTPSQTTPPDRVRQTPGGKQSDPTNAQPRQQANDQPHQQANDRPQMQAGDQSREQVREQPKEQPREQPRQQVREQPKEQPREQPKEQTREPAQPKEQPRQQQQQRSSGRSDIDADQSARQRGADRANQFGQRYGNSRG